MSGKRLHRSLKNKVIAGVCGGIGEYLDVDPVLIRILLVVLVLCFHWDSMLVVAYIAAAFLLPKDE